MSDEEIIQCFKMLDPEKKGTISAEDMRHMLTAMGDKFDDALADAFLKDAGGSSKIDYEAFVKKMNAKAKE
jgi:Ca2+-binding EF-hand superfamily protein